MVVRVTVVGGGVNGIGTALALQRKVPRCQITVVSKDFTPDTTGDGAAGFWSPYLAQSTPDDKILQWGQDTWNLFSEWWMSGENWGLSVVSGVTLSDDDMPQKTWRDIPFSYQTLTSEDCSKYGSKYASGYRFTTFTAEASRFLPKMMKQFRNCGGMFEKKSINSLEEVAGTADIIINCSGLGARDLVPDETVYPCRGQVFRVKAPWVDQFFNDESEDSYCYILPNTETVVLGGTHQDGDWRREVDPTDSEMIWKNCIQAIPSLKNCEVVKEWVGLRPCREGGIRVEAENMKTSTNRSVPVVHNYGHGGSGVSTFWGCSQEAASIAADLINKYFGPPSKL